MRIQQLHYIIKIVETGSMNEAKNNFSSHNQVFQMLFVTWKEKWELISLSVTLKESP